MTIIVGDPSSVSGATDFNFDVVFPKKTYAFPSTF